MLAPRKIAPRLNMDSWRCVTQSVMFENGIQLYSSVVNWECYEYLYRYDLLTSGNSLVSSILTIHRM